jgi:error-prone DNA polymerase
MPETPDPKIRAHPYRADSLPFPSDASARIAASAPAIPYAELHVRSNFTFLTGASHAEELVEQAARLGHTAACITDVNTFAGIVRAHVAAKQVGIPLGIGAELVFGLAPGTSSAKSGASLNRPLQTESLTASSLGGRGWSAAPPPATSGQAFGLKGSRLLSILAFPTDRASYSRLSRLLTLGKRRAPKGECHLVIHDLIEHQEGLLAVIIPPPILDESFIEIVDGLRRVFDDDRLSIAASRSYGHDDAVRLAQISALCVHTRVPMVAANAVLCHAPERHELQDVLTCIRLGCTIEQAGTRLQANAERHLKSPQEMSRLFAEYPQAVARSAAIAKRAAAFSLDQIKYQYPSEVCPPGRTPMEQLRRLSLHGAAKRYKNSTTGAAIPPKILDLLQKEFALIEELNFPQYFLTVHDIVRFARGRGILCQGRGAAANSVVCYCLGVTSVDPSKIDLLFERFVSKERNEPPDIDIDFEHERREEVIQYIYSKYGRHRAALTAEVISYRSRSAVRDVGKAMGLSLDAVDRMAKSFDWWDHGAVRNARLRELGLNPDDPTLQSVIRLTSELLGFPRHLSQHVGGFVITQDPLSDLVPIENAAMEDRTVIEWDKDDIDAMGFMKVDCLGLGMLTCIRRAFDFVASTAIASPEGAPDSSPGRKPWGSNRDMHRAPKGRNKVGSKRVGNGDRAAASRLNSPPVRPPGAYVPGCVLPPLRGLRTSRTPRLQLSTVPSDDPVVYDMICRADTIGVFQVESRAQMSMLPRLRPRNFYDLVIEVAIVRPGPIQGDMVHPYLRRRNNEEPVDYPSDGVRDVLKRTLGVPLFQEQAMKLSIVAAGFSPGEADQLRRAMAAWKRKGDRLLAFEGRFLHGMKENGYEAEFAQRCFNQLKGFSEYGFPESHAASFALLVYVSAWLKCRHPAAFAAALINSQPMGFYAPAQIVRDAQEHGVEAREVDVNLSGWGCTLEKRDGASPLFNDQSGHDWTQAGRSGPALRLGMCLVKGVSEAEATLIEDAVYAHGAFRDIAALHRASGVKVATLRKLAQADAFQSMGLDRQHALWAVRELRDEELPLLEQKWQRGEGAEGQRDDGAVDASPLPLCASVSLSLSLPHIPAPTRVIHDYAATGLSLKAHPISFMRKHLDERRVTPNFHLRDTRKCPSGRQLCVAGIVLVRQRPATASGVVFFTIEDETGIANLIVRPQIYGRYRRDARHSVIILAYGKIERQGDVVHVLVSRISTLDEEMTELTAKSRDFH